MEYIFTIDDVRTFLAEELKYVWDGEIDGKKVSTKIFNVGTSAYGNVPEPVSIPVIDIANGDRQINVELFVSNTEFKRDYNLDVHNPPVYLSYSENWQEFLFRTHPDIYAPFYVQIYEQKLKKLLETAPRKGLRKQKFKNLTDEARFKSYTSKIDEAKQIISAGLNV